MASVMNSSHVKNPVLPCLLMIAGFTWLNPHVWIDMVMVVGATAQSYPAEFRFYFILGVSLFSTLWFLLLGYGSSLIRPLFQSPKVWRVINFLTGFTMLCLVFYLIRKI